MGGGRVIHPSRGRPLVRVLVTTVDGQTWCPGRCRWSTRLECDVVVHSVEWWPPDCVFPRVDDFPDDRVRRVRRVAGRA